ncbi:MAG: penicillin acylase family protein [Pseudomonadota bacterium]
MRLTHPLLFRFLSWVLLPVLALAAGTLWYFQSSKAITEGATVAPGLLQQATLARDAQGVVHIRAGSERDVYFAMGYAHAQDRLWQLELQRRIAQGRLSEVFGRKSVRQDVWFRTLGLYQAAESAWPALSKPAQESLAAYAAGINAQVASRKALPPEFVLLGIRPEAWRPIDSLAWIKVFALNLGGNFTQEIERFIAAQALDQPHLQALYGGYPADAPTTVAPAAGARIAARTMAGLLDVQHSLERDAQIGGRFVGSNAWVVSGKLSEGGKAILANDPHLSLQMPSLWYAVSQKGGKLDTAGMSLVGLPLVIFGKNAQIAWGGTSMMADVQDLYVEQASPTDPARYMDDGALKTFATRTELINIKADFPAALHEPLAPIKIQVRSSERGPIVSDVVNVFDQPVSLRWTALDAGDTTYESFFRVNYATDWNSFRAALAFHVAPTLNMLYIDNADNIGYVGAGRIPLRASGDGSLPSPAASGAQRWTGAIPAAAMPASFNPARGFIVSANNKVTGPDYPHFISNDWAPPARAERIEQLLAARVAEGKPVSVDYMLTMQSDLLNREALRMLPLLANYKGSDERQRRALAYLARWNANMGLDSQAASIYTAWMRHLRTSLFGARLSGYWNKEGKDSYLDAVAANTSIDTLYSSLTGKSGLWCDGAQGERRCDAALGASLELALDELQKLRGTNMDNWAWGEVHTTYFKHMPFSEVKLLEMLFTRKLASGGAPGTINAANASFQQSKGYVQNFGAAFRQVIQPGTGRHLYINSTGQSGHPLSSHYADMVGPFGRGNYYNLDPGTAAPATTLTLSPQP